MDWDSAAFLGVGSLLATIVSISISARFNRRHATREDKADAIAEEGERFKVRCMAAQSAVLADIRTQNARIHARLDEMGQELYKLSGAVSAMRNGEMQARISAAVRDALK